MTSDIRRMNENDKAEYFGMSRDFYAAGVTNSVITDDGREKFWKEILCGEIVKAFIIEYNEKIAGYSICCLSASQEACGRILWIDELFIKPEYRGKGLGKQFFGFIESCGEYGFIRLEAEKDNSKAIKLYKSLGYEDCEYISLYKKLRG